MRGVQRVAEPATTGFEVKRADATIDSQPAVAHSTMTDAVMIEPVVVFGTASGACADGTRIV